MYQKNEQPYGPYAFGVLTKRDHHLNYTLQRQNPVAVGIDNKGHVISFCHFLNTKGYGIKFMIEASNNDRLFSVMNNRSIGLSGKVVSDVQVILK